jgi:type II secretion system protein G
MKIHDNSIKGFTLIELLVVVAIIGVLSALLMTNFVGIRQRARDGQRKSDLRQIQSVLELYRADVGAYPDTNAFPTCGNTFSVVNGGNTTTYMKSVPCDPLTKSSYQYQATTTNYCLRSCLENTSDPQKTDGSASCNGFTWTSCGSSVNFTVENP